MTLDTIQEQLEDDGIPVKIEETRLDEGEKLVVDVSELSDNKASQIEYFCTSNNALITKRGETWIVEPL